MSIRIISRRKVWLEYRGKPLLGEGRYRLLKYISASHSLKKSAAQLGISYKTAYNYLRRIERNLGRRIITSQKGGPAAGGHTELTPLGVMLVHRYEQVAR